MENLKKNNLAVHLNNVQKHQYQAYNIYLAGIDKFKKYCIFITCYNWFYAIYELKSYNSSNQQWSY